MNQIGFEFPQPLAEKYRPLRIANFARIRLALSRPAKSVALRRAKRYLTRKRQAHRSLASTSRAASRPCEGSDAGSDSGRLPEVLLFAAPAGQLAACEIPPRAH